MIGKWKYIVRFMTAVVQIVVTLIIVLGGYAFFLQSRIAFEVSILLVQVCMLY